MMLWSLATHSVMYAAADMHSRKGCCTLTTFTEWKLLLKHIFKGPVSVWTATNMKRPGTEEDIVSAAAELLCDAQHWQDKNGNAGHYHQAVKPNIIMYHQNKESSHSEELPDCQLTQQKSINNT